MLPNSWQHVQRVLGIQLSNSEDMLLTSSVLQTLRQSIPNATITLMATPAQSPLSLQMPWVDDVLVYEGAGFTSMNAEREMALIETLRARAFNAAVIFTTAGESPYPLAYICYLAGIPIRLGQSQEFGGSLLSESALPTE